MQTANIFSFHGGIHPPENKTQSLRLPLGRPSLPTELVLPLGQHIGQNSRPLVNAGDKVLTGQTIAINNGFLSSYLHAPTSGTIKVIEQRPVAHPSGLNDMCIVITPDGDNKWCELTPLQNWNTISKTDVLAYLAEMGIVGMGGAGFPTQVKLQGAFKHPLTHFIINAAECEPYITADDMLIREKTIELVLGIEALQHIVEAEQVIIGIEDNKSAAIVELNKTLSERQSKIQVAVVPTKYPSGGEKQLIQLLTGKEVPSGQHPADIGILCQNVGTCVAIHDAIYLGKPLISRFTTLTGDALKAPQNVDVLFGTPVSHLLDYAESDSKKLTRLVMGGPMMGYTLDSANVPIVKTSNCILAATKKEFPTPAPEQACIRCGMCEQACPASLLPQQLLWFSKSQELEKAEHYNLFDCIECGACSYVCPSSIPLVQYYRHSKSSIREARESAVKSDLAKQRFEARKARQEAEAAEKDAKRLARQKATSNKSADAKKAAPKATQTTTAPAGDDSKKLKVDIVIAKTKLKKLEKQLLEAQENEHTEEIDNLQLQATEQEKALKQLEEQLTNIVTSEPVVVAKDSVNDALKKAKVDVALTGVKLKKIQKQLTESPDDNELKEKVIQFEQDLSEAQTRLEQLSRAESMNQATPTAETVDEFKKLKIDTAIAKAAVKKVEKALKKAEELQSPELETIRQQLQEAQQRAEGLEKALANPSAAPATKAAPLPNNNANEDKQRKIDLAIAKATVKKAEKGILALKEQGKDDVEITNSGLPAKLAEAQAKLMSLESVVSQTDSTAKERPAEQDNENQQAEQIKKHKIAIALAKAQINKLTKRLDNAPEEADSILQDIAVAMQKRQDAEALLAQLTPSQDNTQETR